MKCDLASRMKKRFDKTGWTIYSLSRNADVFYTITHGFIKRNRNITIATVSKLCDALGLELRRVND